MLNYKTKRSRGFHPRRCGSPDAITPEQVLRHHRSAQGRHGGTGSCPLLHSYQHLEFHINGKGILQSLNSVKTIHGKIRKMMSGSPKVDLKETEKLKKLIFFVC